MTEFVTSITQPLLQALATAIAGLVVALLSSVIPYVLELAALQVIRAATFGILMSLEPAVAALCGAAFIGQGVSGTEGVAIGCVIVASLGASLQNSRDESLPKLEG